jgi:5-deoxy-D-glucuronate isomerase
MANSLTALLNSSNLDTNNGRYVHNIFNACGQGKLKHNSGTVTEKKNGKSWPRHKQTSDRRPKEWKPQMSI